MGLVGALSAHLCGFVWCGSCGERTFLDLSIAGFFVSISQPRSTFNILSAGLFLTSSSLAPLSCATPIVVTVASSVYATSLSNEISVAEAHTLENSLPAIISAVSENTASISSVQPVIANVDSGLAKTLSNGLRHRCGPRQPQHLPSGSHW